MFYPLRCQFSRTISRSRTRLRVIFFHSGVVTRSESQSQGSWIGNRVLPEDLTNTLVPEKRLPWGFISQEIVENEVIPKAKHSGILSFLDSIKWIGVGPLDGLMYFNLDVDEVTEGVKQAYRVTTDIYSEGKPVFESQYGDIIDPKLGRCFDSHIKQYDGEPNIATKVNVEEIVDVEVYLCFPFFRSDHGKYLLSKLGENELTNNIVTLQKCLTTMWNELDSESPGTLTLVITACVTVGTIVLS